MEGELQKQRDTYIYIYINIYLTGVDVGEGGTPAVVAEAELNDGRAEEDE